MATPTIALISSSEKLAQLYNLKKMMTTLAQWIEEAGAFPICKNMEQLTGRNAPLPLPVFNDLSIWLRDSGYSFKQHDKGPDRNISADRALMNWECVIDVGARAL